MRKRIIFSGNSVTVIFENGDVRTKQGINKEFKQALSDCTTEEELYELMKEENIPEEKIVKVDKSEFEKWISQENKRCVEIFKKPSSQYFVYEDAITGNYKLVRDILMKTEGFKSKNHIILGNLESLFNERITNSIKNRIKLIV